MDKNLKLTETVSINAPASEVWGALTDSATIQKFMWGTHATSEWKKGSPLTFEGEWEGKPYREKGTILEIEQEKLLKYTYLSSGNDDKPKNYAIITYRLSGNNGTTQMSVTQEGAKSQEALEHSKDGWKSILGNLKKTAGRIKARHTSISARRDQQYPGSTTTRSLLFRIRV